MGRWEYFVAASVCLAACSFDNSNTSGPKGNESTDPFVDASIAPDADPTAPDASVDPVLVCDSTLADLVLCMQFEDVAGSTTLLDESQYNNHAMVSGAAFGPGKGGRSLQGGPNFDSQIDSSSSLDVTTEFTIEAWINPDEEIEERQRIFDNGDQYSLVVAPDNKLRCFTVGGPSATSDENALTRARWQHVACVYDGATMVLYVDGTVVKSVSGTGTISTNGANGSSLAQNNHDGEEFHGRIDTLRVWDSARTKALLCSGAGLPCLGN